MTPHLLTGTGFGLLLGMFLIITGDVLDWWSIQGPLRWYVMGMNCLGAVLASVGILLYRAVRKRKAP